MKTTKLTHTRYIAEYGETRMELVQNAAAMLAKDLQRIHDEMPIGELKRDYQRHHIAEAFFNQVKSAKRWVNNTTAFAAYSIKELVDAPKWNLINPQYFATIGGLRVIWDQNQKAKAHAVFEGGLKVWSSQPKALCFEHVYPTSKMIERTYSKSFRTLKQLVYYVTQRSILSYTSAEEDKKLHKNEMTDTGNFFCRYDDIGLITYPLKAEWSQYNRNAAPDKLAKDAKKAKANGIKFEEWAESVIYTH